MSINFEGRVAIVTGAGNGLGRSHALALAERGAKVVVNDLGGARDGTGASSDAAMEVVGLIEAAGGEAFAHGANVAKFVEVEDMVKQAMDKWGRVDILINNAGITRDNILLRMKQEEWDEIISTNLASVFKMSKAVLRGMMKKKAGRIISITSVVGAMGNSGQTNYAAAKSGIMGFTKSLAREVGSRGITVNTVAPGFIQTDMTDALPDEQKKALSSQIPMARLGSVEEIAQAVLFLAGDGGSYITAQTLHVNGGMYSV